MDQLPVPPPPPLPLNQLPPPRLIRQWRTRRVESVPEARYRGFCNLHECAADHHFNTCGYALEEFPLLQKVHRQLLSIVPLQT